MPCQSFSGDALDRGFAGGINDVDFAEATLPCRRQRGANLGRVVAVVIDHANARSFAPHLEATVNAAEVFEGGADVVGRDVETDSDRNGCGRVQNVMHSGHMQTEFPQVAFPVGNTKMADGLPFSRLECRFPLLDLKVRSSPRPVSHGASPNL